MWDRFTPDARSVMRSSKAAAAEIGRKYLGTEHVLLAVASTPQCTAVRVLQELGIEPHVLRSQVECLVEKGPRIDFPPVHYPFTPGCKRALERAQETADGYGHDHIGTGHLLLALREQDGEIAARSLTQLGADPTAVRNRFERLWPRGARRVVPRNVAALDQALQRARAEAEQRGHADIDVPHVLLALLGSEDGGAASFAAELGLDHEAVRARLHRVLDERTDAR